ncbi:MAG: efflux RND transporter periplasmic adaptor subunit [Sulfuricella sp.]|nr:efflux RND transporter periplasmic adaptor subunit [Sulfuricella sp.]
MKSSCLKSLWVAGLLATLAACSEKPVEVQAPAEAKVDGDTVQILAKESAAFIKVEAASADNGGNLRLPGRLVWNEDRTVRVMPSVAGRVLRIHVQAGQRVSAGQPLLTLSSPDFGQADAEWRKAQADADLALRTEARNKELLEGGALARKDWEQSAADLARARAELARAESRLKALGGSRGNQEYTLTSPLTGIVVERNVNPGQELRPDQPPPAPLFVVTDPLSLWLQADARETDLAVLRPGMTVQVEAPPLPGVFPATVEQVADFVDPVTRTVRLRARLDNPQRQLKGEMFVTAVIPTPAGGKPVVPVKAVFLLGEKRYLFVETGPATYRRQEVVTGPERDGKVVVQAGVQPGERIVVKGNLLFTRLFPAVPK